MTQLSEKKCVPCEGNISAFDYSEIHKYLKKVNGWEVKQNDKKNYYLEKDFKLLSSIQISDLPKDGVFSIKVQKLFFNLSKRSFIIFLSAF